MHVTTDGLRTKGRAREHDWDRHQEVSAPPFGAVIGVRDMLQASDGEGKQMCDSSASGSNGHFEQVYLRLHVFRP